MISKGAISLGIAVAITGCAQLQELDQAAGRAIGLGPAKTLEQRYARQSWASVSVQQADAECQAEINKPGGTPNMYLCMRAKGWQER